MTNTAQSSLNAYIARDLAEARGQRESVTRVDEIRAERAAQSIMDWIATNAPDAVAPLRAAGLLIWTPMDEFGR